MAPTFIFYMGWPAMLSSSISTMERPSLDDPYMYQNRRTGQASSAPLTIRQLCRLLCPPPRSAGPSGSASIVTAETPVIGYDPATGQYSAEGWVAARTVPVLREAGASWYYEVSAAAGGDGSGGNQVKGPISARELSRLMELANNNNTDDYGDGDGDGGNGTSTSSDDVIDGLTRVWSSDIASSPSSADDGESSSQEQQQQQWKSISELPFLRLALDAFGGSHPTWANETAPPSTSTEKKQKLREGNGSNANNQVQTYDEAAMTYDACSTGDDADHTHTKAQVVVGDDKEEKEGLSKQEAEDLEAFLNATAQAGGDDDNRNGGNDEEDEEEEYESDGGTRYVRDAQTGGWIHEDLAPKKKSVASSNKTVSSFDRTVHHVNRGPSSDTKSATSGAGALGAGRKRKKKGKFSAKNAKCWVYVTGLPYDTDEDELAKYFGRVGVLDLDPETQHPKIKLYRRRKGDSAGPEGSLKGDASICYAREESVDLALQFLSDSFLRPDSKQKLLVQRAKFEQHGDKFEDRGRISNAKRKVAKLAALQAVGWDEGENGRITGGKKGLCIIVLKGMFDLVAMKNEGEDKVLSALEQEIRKDCEPLGDVEKITAFSKNPEGVIVVKFGQPTAASDAIAKYHGTMQKGRRIDASFWDGVTDYTVEEKEENKRLDEFGKWLDNQEELPEEYRLNVESTLRN
jgi:HIV Tat-specific factor 1